MIQRELNDYKLLFRSIPGWVIALYCCSVIGMNLMANKIILNSALVSADGGFLLSWIPFLCMDVLIKRYGGRAAVKVNVFAILVNILFVILFYFVAAVQIDIGPACQQGDIYEAFNSVFKSTWFIVFGSCLASFVSCIMNSICNVAVGKLFKSNPDSKLAFFTRSYVSTFIAQFVDNLVFAVTVFMIFAPIYWGYSLTIVQCTGAGILGAALELLMEVVFSPIGYKVLRGWERENVGADYLNQLQEG